MSDDTLRFALIGCGRIARAHLAAVEACAGASVVAVVDRRASAREAFAERSGAASFADSSEPALADIADAAIVCTPPVTHAAISRVLLEADLHVLSEKPFTLDRRSADSLVALAEERGRVVMMASKFRYVPDVVEAKAILESGAIGRPLAYDCAFCGKVDMRGRWNSDPAVSGGGVLVDHGSHAVDLARFLCGPIRSVQAQELPRVQELEVGDSARFDFWTEAGCRGSATLSWSLDPGLDDYVRILGTEGRLELGWKGSRYRAAGGSWVSFGEGYDKERAIACQCADFARVLRDGAQGLISTEDALASVEVVAAAQDSLAGGGWVELGSGFSRKFVPGSVRN